MAGSTDNDVYFLPFYIFTINFPLKVVDKMQIDSTFIDILQENVTIADKILTKCVHIIKIKLNICIKYIQIIPVDYIKRSGHL